MITTRGTGDHDGVEQVITMAWRAHAGKSTTGAILARRLGLSFVDLDKEVAAGVGDISTFIDRHGYEAYACCNVETYHRLQQRARPPGVVALSSGFMVYPPDTHPDYEHIRTKVAESPTTFVLLPSTDLETCVAEIVRRQLSRAFSRSALKEEEVIRARFRLYLGLPATAISTMRPAREVAEEIAMRVAAATP